MPLEEVGVARWFVDDKLSGARLEMNDNDHQARWTHAIGVCHAKQTGNQA